MAARGRNKGRGKHVDRMDKRGQSKSTRRCRSRKRETRRRRSRFEPGQSSPEERKKKRRPRERTLVGLEASAGKEEKVNEWSGESTRAYPAS